jgi:histone-lysine N-methyltransferase SETD3
MMGESDAQLCDVVQHFNKLHIDISVHTSMALFLLEERAKHMESFYFPYIDTLPKSYSDMPLFFGNDCKNRLCGSFTLPMLQMKCTSIHEEYDHLCRMSPVKMQNISLVDFQWARTVVITRVFSCASLQTRPDHEQCLVPIADMMNHTHEPTIEWFFDDVKNGFVMRCTKSVFKGSQLFDSYGVKCNSRYFMNYGFTLNNNQKNNQASIFLPVTCPDQIKTLIGPPTTYDDGYSGYSYCIDNNLESKVNRDKLFRFQVPIISGEDKYNKKLHTIIQAMFNFLRLNVITKSEDIKKIRTWQRNSESSEPSLFNWQVPFISESNELLCLDFLRFHCKKRLEDYKSSIEEDRLKLEKLQPFSTEYNICCMLISEKEVLHYYIDLSDFVHSNTTNLRKNLRNNFKFSSYYRLFWSEPVR